MELTFIVASIGAITGITSAFVTAFIALRKLPAERKKAEAETAVTDAESALAGSEDSAESFATAEADALADAANKEVTDAVVAAVNDLLAGKTV